MQINIQKKVNNFIVKSDESLKNFVHDLNTDFFTENNYIDKFNNKFYFDLRKDNNPYTIDNLNPIFFDDTWKFFLV